MGITVIGGGLAGCEAAWQLAKRKVPVRLIEMKPVKFSPAHSSENLGELVCSNSFRSGEFGSASGLLKEELRILDSLIMEAADLNRVPAGKALAVDRELFSKYITDRIASNRLISLERHELKKITDETDDLMIIATGPLTSDALTADIAGLLGGEGLSFYDAIAPIVTAESLDMIKLFRASRYGDGEGDYLNSAMDEQLYRDFVAAIVAAAKVDPYPFEKIPHFEGCLPIEVLASRGPDTLAFGPMKPVGLKDPATGEQPYAVVQLRAENKECSLYNLVGFQTKMTHPEQDRVFRMIPGLEKADFVRLGSIHRNTYLDSPRLLDLHSRARARPQMFFAGQITGVEGYLESTASGLAVGIMAAFLSKGITPLPPPSATAVGALLKHTRDLSAKKKFEPMNVNFGIIDPPPNKVPKKLKKTVVVERALASLREWKTHMETIWQ